MKKIITLAITLALCLFTSQLIAQNLSASQAKKLLQSNEWIMQEYLVDGKEAKDKQGVVGMKALFMKNGQMVMYREAPEDAGESYKYEVTDGYIIMGENVEDPHFKYSFNSNQDVMNMNDIDIAGAVTTWKKVRTVSEKDYPKNMPKSVYSNSYTAVPEGAQAIINTINSIVKEAEDNLYFYDKTKKETIKTASFTASETGIRFTKVVEVASGKRVTHTYDFVPNTLEMHKAASVDKNSPTGSLIITMMDRDVVYDIELAGSAPTNIIVDYVYLPYLKIDEANYEKLNKALTKLAELYKNKANRLVKLENRIWEVMDKSWWISRNGASKTYGLYDVRVRGGKIMYYYTLESLSSSGDSHGDFVTIVPLANIDEISFDKSKSKPGNIILKAGKTSFRTYSRTKEDERYSETTRVNEIPLFIDVSDETTRERVVELLSTHARELGGNKLKL